MEEKSNISELFRIVTLKSSVQDWENARKEWKCVGSDENTEGYCTCGHHLYNLYYIKNVINGNRLIVGSVCVKKFENFQMTNFVQEEEKYRALKKQQSNNGIPLSLKHDFLEQRISEGALTEFEIKFYKDIWKRTKLSHKQINLKKRINYKLESKIN